MKKQRIIQQPENKKNYTLQEALNEAVAKDRQKRLSFYEYPENKKSQLYRECLGCLAEINGFDKKTNKLTCSVFCGL
jgi:hypothetical protein